MTPSPRWLRCLMAAACILATAGCATFQGVGRGLPRATKPVKYKMAGADIELRKHLDRGLTQIKEENYRGALGSLNRAVWDLERVESRWLRLEDLAEVHQALADAYAGLRKPSWAEEARKLSLALTEQVRRDPEGDWPERSLARAKEAYAKAQFRASLGILGQALVDLEDVAQTALRVRRLEETRCYLAFTFLALEEEDRSKEELERLWTLDPTLAFCSREAPPAIRRLVGEVRRAAPR